MISIPDDHNVHGNTHLMMQDDNNLPIADLTIDWLADDGRPHWLLSLPRVVHGAGD